MTGITQSESQPKFRATVIGWFFVYFGIATLLGGLAIGYLYQLSESIGGTAAPSVDSVEIEAVRRSLSLWFGIAIALAASGIGLIVFGVFRVIRPIEVESLRQTP